MSEVENKNNINNQLQDKNVNVISSNNSVDLDISSSSYNASSTNVSTNANSSASDDDTASEYEYAEEDLMYYERAIKEIAKGDSYNCMICTVEMDYTCKMYACKHCFRVFDYDCIREWALKSTEKTIDRTWKCPNCYHVNKKVPIKDRPTCWCGKVVNPDANPLDPNSCGQTCDAPICPHRCLKSCHLGPHPECMQMLKITCKCGKSTKHIYCHESRKQKNIFQCDQECGLTLACGIHKCKRVCHSGLCGSCPEILTTKNNKAAASIKCYCGTESRELIKCKNVSFPKSGAMSQDSKCNKWVGVFNCTKMRSVAYNCGNHTFVEGCIAPPTIDKKRQCPFAPNLLTTCPCGKTNLDVLSCKREQCTDPIPTCENMCDKPLKCGKHKCPFTCHTGPCMDPCIQIEKSLCACERKSYLIPCKFTDIPHCNYKCESLMSCRRHRCMDICCSGRPQAEKRKKSGFISKETLYDETLIEAEHVCLKDCNLKLLCGIHNCKRKCHPGPCPPCIESDSNDLVCPCGKTIVPAPVRCGTELPPCKYPCIKVVNGESECGHKPIPHTCHPVNQPCPVCTATVFKKCKCGKRDDVRTMCFQDDVSCGLVCGKKLKSCHHKCQKRCHSSGTCQTDCKQVCNLQRINCEHKCIQKCHGNKPCPDLPCTHITTVSCDCGVKSIQKPCGATSIQTSISKREKLDCDEECQIIQRRKELKEAFGIVDVENEDSTTIAIENIRNRIEKSSTYEELELPYAEAVLSVYSKQIKWCSQIEKILDDFIDDKPKSSLHFKHMKAPQRSFVHGLANAFNIYSEAQDPEPFRSVYIKKTQDSAKPLLNLSEALPLYLSFREFQKEKKRKEFEAIPKVLLNIDADDQPKNVVTNNGFMISNLTKGLTEDDLEQIFGTCFNGTLIKEPQYLVMENNAHGFICPINYPDISVNVERDMEQLIGFLNEICQDKLVGNSVTLCNIDKELLNDDSVEFGTSTLNEDAKSEL